jgi:TonB family protein
MPITQIPFQDPVAPPEKPQAEQLGLYDAEDWETAYRELDHRVPHLIIQLQDDLTRSRRREAAWISIITHLVLAILLLNIKLLEKLIPARFLVVATQKEPNKGRQLTYLELPPDLQKAPPRSKSNIVSDKNRVATTPHPELDPKELKVPPSPPPGRPGMSGPRTQQPPAQPPQAMAQNQPPQQQPGQQQPMRAPDPSQTAQLQMPAQSNNNDDFNKYKGSLSPGSAIQQATQAAADSRRTGGGGQEGDFGLGTGARGRQFGALDILSDTQGVDFQPYLQRILQDVRQNWYLLIPESAQMKKGKLALEFVIMKDGSVAGLKLVASSGDATLDRPAWGSITHSNPFPPLPTEFGGQYLALRFRFYYNPDKADLQ